MSAHDQIRAAIDRFRPLRSDFAAKFSASTFQGYQAGAKPGMDALVRLARAGNVDLNWLVSGRGEIRPIRALNSVSARARAEGGRLRRA